VSGTSFHPQFKMKRNWWFTNGRKLWVIETPFSRIAKRAAKRSLNRMWRHFSSDDAYTKILGVSCPAPGWNFSPFNQILMTAQVIPVRTTEPVQTEWTDSTAVVRQDLTGRDVKKVLLFIIINYINKLIFFLSDNPSTNRINLTS